MFFDVVENIKSGTWHATSGKQIEESNVLDSGENVTTG